MGSKIRDLKMNIFPSPFPGNSISVWPSCLVSQMAQRCPSSVSIRSAFGWPAQFFMNFRKSSKDCWHGVISSSLAASYSSLMRRSQAGSSVPSDAWGGPAKMAGSAWTATLPISLFSPRVGSGSSTPWPLIVLSSRTIRRSSGSAWDSVVALGVWSVDFQSFTSRLLSRRLGGSA